MGNVPMLAYSIYHYNGMDMVNEMAIPEGSRKAIRIPTEWSESKRNTLDKSLVDVDEFGLRHKIALLPGLAKAATSYEIRINCPHFDLAGKVTGGADEWMHLNEDEIKITTHRVTSEFMDCRRLCITAHPNETKAFLLPKAFIPPAVIFDSEETVWTRKKSRHSTWFGLDSKQDVSNWGFKKYWKSLGKSPSEIKTLIDKTSYFSFDWQVAKKAEKLPTSFGWIVDVIYQEPGMQSNCHTLPDIESYLAIHPPTEDPWRRTTEKTTTWTWNF